MSTQFNDDDPWHTNAHLMFCFECMGCVSLFDGCDDDGFTDKVFLDWCVTISADAQSLGWTCVDDYIFLCPACSAKPISHRFLRPFRNNILGWSAILVGLLLLGIAVAYRFVAEPEVTCAKIGSAGDTSERSTAAGVYPCPTFLEGSVACSNPQHDAEPANFPITVCSSEL